MSVHTLRLWLEGPLQAWGTSSRFEVRTTDLWPSKSGVVGLLAAALGRPRDEPVDDLAALRFGVRVESPGYVMRDYQTVGGGVTSEGIAVASGAKSQRRGIQTERYYLEDAKFVAAFEGARELLEECARALAAPRWPLALGRRACPPSAPILQPDALVELTLERALRAQWGGGPTGLAALEPTQSRDVTATVQLLVEDALGELEFQDQPIGAAFATRQFALRRVRSEFAVRSVS